jgi:ankyrin repeat protein
MSPLIFAAREGHAKVVERLVNKGAVLNRQDNRGWTVRAMQIIIYMGASFLEVVRMRVFLSHKRSFFQIIHSLPFS